MAANQLTTPPPDLEKPVQVRAWHILRNRDYALLWLASLLSDLCTWMQIAALGIFVTESTGRAGWTGVATTVTYLTAGLFLPLGGVLADRYDKRHLVMVALALQTTTGIALAAVFAAGHDSPGVLVLLAGVQGIFASAAKPAIAGMIPDVVKHHEVPQAALFDQASWNLGRAAGPAVAIAVIHLASYQAVFAINALSFLAMAVAALLLQTRPARHPQGGTVVQRLADGAREFRGNRSCRLALTFGLADMAFVAPFLALLPAFAQLTLDGDPGDTSRLFVVQGLASALTMIGAVMAVHRFGSLRTMVVFVALAPLFAMAFALSPTVLIATFLIVPLSAMHTGAYATSASTVQSTAAAHVRGRAIAFHSSLCCVGYALTSTVLALVANHTGVRLPLFIGAVAMALGVMAWLAVRWFHSAVTPGQT